MKFIVQKCADFKTECSTKLLVVVPLESASKTPVRRSKKKKRQRRVLGEET